MIRQRADSAKAADDVQQAVGAKKASAEAEGIKLLELSIIEPTGPALISTKEAAAAAVMNYARNPCGLVLKLGPMHSGIQHPQLLQERHGTGRG